MREGETLVTVRGANSNEGTKYVCSDRAEEPSNRLKSRAAGWFEISARPSRRNSIIEEVGVSIRKIHGTRIHPVNIS